MILAYHAMFTTYGTWLPNDPRGSYSKAVYNEELRALGDVKRGRQFPQPSRATIRRFHTAAMPRLVRKPYYINDATRLVIAAAFGNVVRRLSLAVPACSIMTNHVHIVVMRPKYRIEYVVNQLKGAATAELKLKKTPWTRKGWNVFLDEEDALPAAIKYVESNPIAAGLPPQRWGFVTPLSDLGNIDDWLSGGTT